MVGMVDQTATTEEVTEATTDAADMVTGIEDTTGAMEAVVATEGEGEGGATLTAATVGKVTAVDDKRDTCQKAKWKIRRCPLTISRNGTRECPWPKAAKCRHRIIK